MRQPLPSVVLAAILSANGSVLVAQQQEPREKQVIDQARAVALATARHRHPAMSTADPAVITSATNSLKAGGSAALTVLRRVMERRDSSYLSRSAAAFGVWLIDSTQVDTVVAILVSQMNRTAFANIHIADELILAIGTPAVPALLRHTDNPMVLSLLGRMGRRAENAVPALRRLLGSSNVEVASVLTAIGSPDAIEAAKPVLVTALRTGSSEDRRIILLTIRDAPAATRDLQPLVRDRLSDNSLEVRLEAARAMVALGDTAAAVPVLVRLLQDSTFDRRFSAIQQLGDAGPAAVAAVPVLLGLVETSIRARPGEAVDALTALHHISPNNQDVKAAITRVSADPARRKDLEVRGVKPR